METVFYLDTAFYNTFLQRFLINIIARYEKKISAKINIVGLSSVREVFTVDSLLL